MVEQIEPRARLQEVEASLDAYRDELVSYDRATVMALQQERQSLLRLDDITAARTAFASFDALLNAKGGYVPTINVRDAGEAAPDMAFLAERYDYYQQQRGDPRRAFVVQPERLVVESGRLSGPGGLTLVIDLQDEATPAMVYATGLAGAQFGASWACAVDTGTLLSHSGRDEEKALTEAQVAWLETQSALVEAAHERAQAEYPEYSVGQRFEFKSGDRVIANGFPGVVRERYSGRAGEPGGMVNVRLPGGVACVSASYPDCYPARWKGVEVVAEGEHIGQVKAVTEQFVIQSVGRGKLVAHEAGKFEQVPVVGEQVTVRYRGHGVQVEAAASREAERGGQER